MESKKLSDRELREKLGELRKELELKGSYPQNIDQTLLLRFLKFYNGNIEKALKRLTFSMELRKSYQNIFYNRDTNDPQLRKLIDQVEMVLLPNVTSSNFRILTLRLIDFNPENLVFDDALSVFTLVHDTTIVTPEKDELADGEIVIFDLKGVTASHLTKLGFTSLRCFLRYMTESHPLKIKGVHIVNSSSLLDKLVMLLRPFLSSKAMKALRFHKPNSSTLYDYIPREILPEEFGGNCGSIESHKLFWIRRTEEHREYLLDDSRWKFVKEKPKEEDSADEAFNYLAFC